MNEVDGKLFTNNPTTTIPNWIDNAGLKPTVKRKMDINFDNNIINRKHVIAERDNNLANVREIKLTFNDKQLKTYAIAQLTKLLRKYRYSIKTAKVENGKVNINVNFDKNPCEYFFTYKENNGKIINEPFFKTICAEQEESYSFNEAGLKDSFAEKHDVKKPIKVASIYNYSVISRYDIVKRCNNSLTKAKELIAQHVANDMIVAVGSNEYASTYDVNYLFPDMRTPMERQASHTADFVNNRVAKGSYENKSANKLALEANNILTSMFNVNKLISASRENDNLFMKAEIIHDNIREIYDFNFNLENEKLATLNYIEDNNSERYSVKQLLSKFGQLNNVIKANLVKNEKISDKYVYSNKAIKKHLSPIMSSKTINKMLDNFVIKNLVTKLNTTTYASKYSLAELISNTNVEFLTEEEQQEIQKAKAVFGSNNHFYSYETKDNDTRTYEAVENSKEYINVRKNICANYFKNFNIIPIDETKFYLSFNEENKKRNILCEYNDNNIKCIIANKVYDIAKTKNIFAKSKLLQQYICDNNINENNNLSNTQKIIITATDFYNKLNDYLEVQDITELLNDLIDTKQLIKIESNKFVSEVSFEDLLRYASVDINEDLKKEHLDYAQRPYQQVLPDYLMDNDTRTYEAVDNSKEYINNIKNIVNDYFKNYDISPTNEDEFVLYFMASDNKRRRVNAKIKDNKILCNVHDKEIDISELANMFKKSELLKNYLTDNRLEDEFDLSNNTRCILSSKDFYNKLNDYLIEEDIAELINILEKDNKIKRISSNTFVSEQSFENLIRNLTNKINNDIKKNKLIKSNKSYVQVLANYLKDNDTRSNVAIDNSKKVFAKVDKIISKYLQNYKLTKLDNLNYQINFISADNKKRSIKASIENKQIICHIGKEKLRLNQLAKRFKNSEILKAYLNDNNSIDKNKIIISKKMFNEKLANYINQEDINNLMQYLIDTKQLVRLSSDTFASEQSFEDLLRNCNYEIDDTIKKELLNKKSLVEQKRLVADYEEDNDTRNVEKTFTENDYKKQFEYMLPEHIKCLAFNSININDNIVVGEIELFNTKLGVSTKTSHTSMIEDGYIAKLPIAYFEKMFQENSLLSSYNKYSSDNKVAHKIVLNKKTILNKLNKLANEKQIENAIKTLVSTGKLKELGNDTYASETSFEELLSQSDIMAYNEETIQKKFKQANKNVQYIPKEYHIQDYDSKSLETIEDGKTSEEFNNLKEQMNEKIIAMYNEQKLTNKKKEILLANIKNSKNVNDINTVYKEMTQYA